MFSKGNHNDLFNSIEAIGASFAIYEYDNEIRDFYLVTANSMYSEIMDIALSRAVGLSIRKLFPRYIEKKIKKCLIECQADQQAIEAEIIIEYKNEARYWRFIFTPVIDIHSRCHRIINTCIEITDKKILEKQLSMASKRFEAVVQSAYDGIITINEEQNISMINEAAKYIFGIEDENVIGKPLTNLMPVKYRRKHVDYVNSFKTSLTESRPMQSRASVRGLRSDGTEFPIEVTISKIKFENTIELTAVVRDISERAMLVEELSKVAKEDSLTGSYNRRYFTELLQNEVLRAKRFHRTITLAILDIDFFKHINDKYGHNCGDYILKELVALISENIRSIDVFARWGGEEFIVLLTETNLDDAVTWAEKVRYLIENNKFIYNSTPINITCSFGVAEVHVESNGIDNIINQVDNKLYEAKQNGRNCVKH